MRKYIAEKTTVHCLKIIEKPGFHDTLQDVVLLILQKKKSHDNFILKTTNGSTYLTPFYNELRELLKGTTTIENLHLRAKTGDVVWNQVKDQLRDEGVLLIYSNNIQNGKLVTGNISAGKKGEKKQYIKENFCRKDPIAVSPLTGKTILVNRGYGNNGNNYSFNFVTVDLQKYYAENHVNVIYPKTTAHADNLKRVEKSFNDERTSQFIKWFVGNGALSARELQCVVPIF
jgi:adenine-specific DNA-methyltransferase